MPASPPPVTRFAPSPTGLLHVGGARTALYAWAFARGRGGRFLLRLEDTDRRRSSDAAAEAILEELDWLGLDWDNRGEEPRQSERLAHYEQVAERLLAGGLAYEDEGAIRFRMDRDITFEDAVYGTVHTTAEDLEDFVIRKADGYPTFHLAVVVDDAEMSVTHVIRGQEHLSNTPKHAALLDALGAPRPTWAHTPSIMNPDGSKMSKRDKAKAARRAAETLMAAEGASAEVFAEEVAALAATPPEALPPATEKHRRLFDATQKTVTAEEVLAFLEKTRDETALAHLVAARAGAELPEIDVQDFRASGYLPDVLCNTIALLGWNPGGDRERFTRGELTELFSLERIGRKNARFDRDKLFRFNADTIAGMTPEAFRETLAAHLDRYHPAFRPLIADPQRFAHFAEAYRPRARTLGEPAELGRFFVQADEALAYDPKAVRKVLKKNDGAGYRALEALRPRLAALETWTGPDLDAAIRELAEQLEVGMGQLAQPLRVAVSGGTVSPAIDQTLLILGREATLARIDRAIARQENEGG